MGYDNSPGAMTGGGRITYFHPPSLGGMLMPILGGYWVDSMYIFTQRNLHAFIAVNLSQSLPISVKIMTGKR